MGNSKGKRSFHYPSVPSRRFPENFLAQKKKKQQNKKKLSLTTHNLNWPLLNFAALKVPP